MADSDGPIEGDEILPAVPTPPASPAPSPQPAIDGQIVLPSAPWDQMPGEPDIAYAQFCRYRDMGRDRTVAKTAYALQRSPGHLNNVAHDWRWVARARAFDAELDRQFAARSVAARMAMAERHAALAADVLAKVHARLLTINIDTMSMLEVARWLEVASRMERNAWAVPATAASSDATDSVDISGLDEEGRRTRLEMLRAELERRLADRNPAAG